MSNTALQHKQQCANRLRSLAQQQVRVGRQIQQLNYVPTTALKAQMDSLMALFGRVRVPVLRTRLSIFDANTGAERIPQVDEVGHDDTLVFLRSELLR